jgi:hypothetical protein
MVACTALTELCWQHSALVLGTGAHLADVAGAPGIVEGDTRVFLRSVVTPDPRRPGVGFPRLHFLST